MSTASPDAREGARGRPRPARNVLSNWGAFALNALIGFLLSPYVVRTLGSDLYGAWVLVGSLVGYLGLLDVGVRGAVTRYVATHHAAHEDEDASRVVAAGLFFFGGAGLLAIALAAVFGYAVLPLFEVPEHLRPELPLAMVLCGASVAVSLVFGVIGGVVTGVQRFDRQNAIGMAVAVLRAVGVVGALELGSGLLGLACVQLGSAVLHGLAISWLARRLYPELSMGRRDWGSAQLRLLLTFGLASALLNVAAMVNDYSSSVVIGTILSVGAITPFAIAATLCSYARAIVSGISYVVTPTVAALARRQEQGQVARLSVSYARYATIVALPILATFLLRGSSFISLWMEPRYAEPGGAVLAVLALSVWAQAGFQVMGCAAMGLNRHAGMVPAFALEALTNLGLSVLLAGPLGLVGVAWGATIPRLALCLLFGPWYARRHIGISFAAYWSHVLLRPSAAMIPFALASHWMEVRWPASGLSSFFAQSLVLLPLAALGAWLVALDRDERRNAWSASGRALRPGATGSTGRKEAEVPAPTMGEVPRGIHKGASHRVPD